MEKQYIYKLKIITVPILLLLLSCSNCICEGIIEADAHAETGISWDLTVSLGNSLQLIFLNDEPNKTNNGIVMESGLKLEEIPLPLPNNSLIVPVKTLHETWTKYVIASLQSDSKRIYYSNFYENVSNIGYYDTITKENGILHQTLNGSIYYMAIHKGSLYFTETLANSYSVISRLNLSGVGSSPEEVVKVLGDSELCGLVIDEQRNTLYWSTFTRNGKSGIYCMDLERPAHEGRLIFDNSATLRKPHALTFDGDWIYFLNTPNSGIKNRIDRIRVGQHGDELSSEEFVSITNIFPFTISILCNDLYWTDTVSRALYVIKDINLEDRHIQKLTTVYDMGYPYALYSKGSMKYCQEKKSAHITKGTAPSGSVTSSPMQITTSPAAPLIISTSKDDPNIYQIHTVRPRECPVSNPAFCSKGSICIELDEQRYCICETGKYGQFCELNIEETSKLAANSSDQINVFTSSWLFIAPVSIMTLVSTVLLIVVIFLWRKVRKLSAKPRIKRRFIVQRRSAPAANSNQSTISSGNHVLNACEMIDIENCCNMNVCETPCYDQIPGINPDDKDLLIPL